MKKYFLVIPYESTRGKKHFILMQAAYQIELLKLFDNKKQKCNDKLVKEIGKSTT